MLQVTIGTEQRSDGEITESWINKSINRRLADGRRPCVRVSIRTDSLNMGLSTPACGGGGGGRPPHPHERRFIELWQKHRLTTTEFTGGELVAFLNGAERLLN